ADAELNRSVARAAVEGAKLRNTRRVRRTHFHRRRTIAVVSLLVAGLAAPIVAHAFGATNAPRMAMVGAPAVFASQSSAAPTTSLPAGTENGTFVVTFVAAAPSSTVNCGWGW